MSDFKEGIGEWVVLDLYLFCGSEEAARNYFAAAQGQAKGKLIVQRMRAASDLNIRRTRSR
jgi:hypothetical protein